MSGKKIERATSVKSPNDTTENKLSQKRTGPTANTRSSPEYKKKLEDSKSESLKLKAKRSALFKTQFRQLGITHEELTRLLYLLPVGKKPTLSQKSKIGEKLGLYSTANARQPNMSDLLAITLMLSLKEQGVDVTKIDFPE